ncbi:MAG TPA: GAF domain-containing protein, partial [Bryobacteraceae bacterium]|nr:GAF domain-containing protein [Bryobacteraceae bacterium]
MPAPEFASLTDSIRRLASTAQSAEALQGGIVELIAARLPYCNWVGFYMLDPNDSNTLVLGPFVGEPTPHVRIPIHQGICGAAVSERATVIVDDVHSDPRYLSCSIKTRSEIVVPIFVDGQVIGEIDIDSHTPAAFTAADRAFLEEIARITGEFLSSPDRRAVLRLIMAAGSAAALLRPSRANAAPKPVRIAAFNAAGVCTGVEQLEKVRKTNAEWKQQLTPEQYSIARERAT